MDRIDEHILRLLRENARITVKLDREQLGLHLIAFVMVQIERSEHIAGFRETIMEADCVLECHHVAGAYDYLLKVALRGTADLERFISETLKQVEGVSKTNTMIALSSMKEEI